MAGGCSEEQQELLWPCSTNDVQLSTPDDMGGQNKVMFKDECPRTPKKKKKVSEEARDSKAREIFPS